jgi:hypothetical protein
VQIWDITSILGKNPLPLSIQDAPVLHRDRSTLLDPTPKKYRKRVMITTPNYQWKGFNLTMWMHELTVIFTSFPSSSK